MIELLLHMNNYSITGAITAYQTYPYISFCSLGYLDWPGVFYKEVLVQVLSS